MITSVSESQDEILRWILELHVKADRFDLDPCHGNGSFYKNIPDPRIKYDIEPRNLDVRQADVRDLPLLTCTVSSAIFDPPYIHAPGKESIMGKRFGGFRSQRDASVMYFGALAELYRVLVPRGVLVVKCQDIIESGKFVANSAKIVNMAVDLGFEQIDTFILVRKSAMQGHNHGDQKHCRKTHAYFIVFKKGKRS